MPELLLIHSNIESFSKPFYSGGQIDAALCRTNHIDTLNIYGLLGSLQIKIANNITSQSVLHLNPATVRGITFSENAVSFNFIDDSVVIDPAFVGINNLPKINLVNVYPNPAKSFLYINSDLKKGQKEEFILFNTDCQQVYNKNFFANSKTQSVNIADLPNGIYFWQVKINENDISNGKLVILK